MSFRPDPRKCFRFEIPLDLSSAEEKVLLDRPGLCRCEVRRIGGDPAYAGFELRENYAGRRPGGSDLALEAEIFLQSTEHPEWTKLRIGIPLSELPECRSVQLVYDLATFRLMTGGRILAEEFPFGNPPGMPDAPYRPAAQHSSMQTLRNALHTWAPEGLNNWVGDVTIFNWKGTIHLFFLYDHRHHGSKFGTGSHFWAHLITKDFKNWQYDDRALPIPEQWITYGTGTPFELNGKLTLAYGYHTERFFPAGVMPEGASYAVSEDGFRFTPSMKIIGTSRNPSIYNRPDGSLLCYRGYGTGWLQLLKAESWPDFRLVNDHVVPSGKESSCSNCLDCPAYFEWHGKNYLLVGFRGMWMADNPDFSGSRDLAGENEAVYDGLEVPMVCPFQQDRRILAGWLRINGQWGGLLGIRELVHFADGVLGTRWLEEVMPEFRHTRPFPEKGGETAPEFELVLTVTGPVTLTLGDGTHVMTLTIRDKSAVMSLDGKETGRSARLRRTDQPYLLRLMVRDERKWCGAVIDAEIAGCRTLIRHSPELHVSHCKIDGNIIQAKIREN